MATANTSSNSQYSVQNLTYNNNNNTSGNFGDWGGTIIKNTGNTFQTLPSQQSSDKSDECNFHTLDGSRCELTGSFDDGRCHWHTEEQCFYPTDDGSPCELTGSGPDNRCHIHTSGCNESLTHNAIEKACFHGMKFSYRMLGLHPDTKRSGGPFSIQPQMAAQVAARVGKAYLETAGLEYDRDDSHEYYLNKIVDDVVDDKSLLDKIKNEFGFLDNGVSLEILKEGIEKAWKQIDSKEHHADGARTAIAAAEHYLGQEIGIEG